MNFLNTYNTNINFSLNLTIGKNAAGAVFQSVGEARIPEGVKAIVTPRQTHTANVGIVTSPDQSFPETDALITQLHGIAPGVRTADCVPIILHAPDIKAVAAIHAGWKGTVGRIVSNTINKMIEMGADPERMYAAIGPCICGDCYEVSEELAQEFENAGLKDAVIKDSNEIEIKFQENNCDNAISNLQHIVSRHGSTTRPKPHIDLVEANRIILIEKGVRQEHIDLCGICTLHSNGGYTYPSWRREPDTTTRLLTIAWLI